MIDEIVERYLTEKTYRMTIDIMSDKEKKFVRDMLSKKQKYLDFSIMGDEIVVDSRDNKLLNDIADKLNGNKKFKFDIDKV